MRIFTIVFLMFAAMSANADTLTAGGSTTLSLPPGQKLTVITEASSTALVNRSTGSTAVETYGMEASETVIFGEYFISQDFRISAITGSLTYEISQSTDKVRTGASIVTSGTINGAAIGGTTPAAGAFTALSATGVISAANGSAAAPSLAFTSDADTGIIRSGANSIGFVTGGTERWVVNSSGSLVPVADGSYDIGNGASDPRDVSLTRDLIAGRHILAGGTPVIGTCGTSPSIVGADNGMTITIGTGGTADACGATFSVAWTNAPACVAQSDTDILPLKIVTTTTTVIVTKASPFTASSKLHVVCMGF